MVLRFLTILEMDLQPQGHGCLSCVNCVLVCQMVIVCEMSALITINPVDTGRKLNVHKTLRRRPGQTSSERLMYVKYYVLCLWGSFF